VNGDKYVVKITRSDDQAKLDAAVHEYKMLSLVPEHANVVKVIDQYVSE